MNLDAISAWLAAFGVHPLLGGFFAGMLVMLIFSLGRRDARHAGDAIRKQPPAFESPPLRQSSNIKVESSVITVKTNGDAIEIPARDSALILEMIRGRRTIEAIKAVRLHSGLGLAEAKRFVEMLEKQMPKM